MGFVSTIIHSFIDGQKAISKLVDKRLDLKFTRDGYRDCADSLVPSLLKPGATIYDIGGGRTPFLSVDVKKRLGLTVIGLDICAQELISAPSGAYDDIIVADICQYKGKGDGDVVICLALLEHVEDVSAALRAMCSILRKGGSLVIFAPSRNAIFARLNLLLPHAWKESLLFTFLPEDRKIRRFPAYYDRCTPMEIEALAKNQGLCISEERLYYMSTYFECFSPVYLLWRIWTLLFYAVAPRQSAETFSLVLRKTNPFPD